MWLNVSSDKLETMSQTISIDGEYIDWRKFLIAAAQPWPEPTQEELLVTLQHFKDMDQQETGCVTREQYERVPLWFQGFSHPETPVDPDAPYPFDRLGNLQLAFFDLFADHNSDPPLLDYTRLVRIFSKLLQTSPRFPHKYLHHTIVFLIAHVLLQQRQRLCRVLARTQCGRG